MKVLIADDEKNVCRLASILVHKLGHEACLAYDGEEALELFFRESPDLLILDVMMPKMNGLEVCKRVRDARSHVPILLLTAKSDIADKRIGFHSGADDYITKPFLDEELTLRIEALLRRASLSQVNSAGLSDSLKVGPFEFSSKKLSVAINGEETLLTPKEYQIIVLLASNPNQTFTSDELIGYVWGEQYISEAINIPTYIHRLRSKIEQNPSKPQYLKTVWGLGYYFNVPHEEEPSSS